MQLGVAIHMYADLNNNNLPPDLEVLYPSLITDKLIFRCRISKNSNAYIYLRMTNRDCNSNNIMLFSKEPVHKGGRVVGYLDAHTEWLPEELFRGKIQAILNNPEQVKDYSEEAIEIMNGYLKDKP